MNTEQKRAAFEAWMRDNHPGHCLIFVNGYYLHKWPQRLWEAYQAGRAALAQPSGQQVPGWKMVPVEPTQEMLDVLTKAAAQTESWRHGYYNMLAAAPVAAQAPAPDGGALDGARMDWFFGSIDKSDFIPTYMQGMREKWTPDQWRAAIDAAMSKEGRGDE